jgi:hypothetical protein
MPKNKNWFRVYDRMIYSPQIIELSDSEFRLLVSLWCLASSFGDEEGSIPYSIPALKRLIMPDRSEEEIKNMLNKLIDIDLLYIDEGILKVSRWKNHQYEYDSRTPEYVREYKKKYRERKKNENMSEECPNDVRSMSEECPKVEKKRIEKKSKEKNIKENIFINNLSKNKNFNLLGGENGTSNREFEENSLNGENREFERWLEGTEDIPVCYIPEILRED